MLVYKIILNLALEHVGVSVSVGHNEIGVIIDSLIGPRGLVEKELQHSKFTKKYENRITKNNIILLTVIKSLK